ncbi:MAG: WYL domain-containing protein [Bacteroidetes bacterium]|nr:WYL domain-containing protein [Bacteroidota bacterium]
MITLKVAHNFKLEKETLGFGEGMTVLEPERLRKAIKNRGRAALNVYEK